MSDGQCVKKRILCVHQGTELYGSDKSFVAAVAAIKATESVNVRVVIPHHGPIQKLFDSYGISDIETRHLWVLRKADLVYGLTFGLFENLRALRRAMKDIRKYDLVYVNTAVILDYLLASILLRRPVVVHVREIPTGFAKRVLSRLLSLARAKLIFNSNATQDAYALPATLAKGVVYNGFETPQRFEKSFYDGQRPLRVLCIGRLNAWKGQEVVITACAQLSPEQREKLSVRIVGGVYKDQVHFRENLSRLIDALDLGSTVELVDFVDEPSAEYISADVVVVPSKLPEPFGRVAIEGMAYCCACIVSGHGGLVEIVADGETGAVFTPGDHKALAKIISDYIETPDLVRLQGNRGGERFAARFTQKACDEALVDVIQNYLT